MVTGLTTITYVPLPQLQTFYPSVGQEHQGAHIVGMENGKHYMQCPIQNNRYERPVVKEGKCSHTIAGKTQKTGGSQGSSSKFTLVSTEDRDYGQSRCQHRGQEDREMDEARRKYWLVTHPQEDMETTRDGERVG